MRSEATSPDPVGGPNPYAAPLSQVKKEPSPITATGGISWPVFLGFGALAGTFFWLSWSIVMSLVLGHALINVLAGPGAACGLLFGVFVGGSMAILMRPATTTVPVANEDDFMNRLDGEMPKLRYRLLTQEEGLRVYGPRTLFRPHAWDISVRVGTGKVTLVGPKANLTALKKRFES